MIQTPQEVVLTAGSRQLRAEFCVSQRSAKSGDAADDPKQQNGAARLNIHQLKAKTRKHAGADHIGDNDRNGCRGGKLDHDWAPSALSRRDKVVKVHAVACEQHHPHL